MNTKYMIKKSALLTLLGALTVMDVSGKSEFNIQTSNDSEEMKTNPEIPKIKIEQNFGYKESNDENFPTVVVNGQTYYRYDPYAEERVTSHQEFIKIKPDPYIETYEEHTLPTTEQMGEWIRKKRNISQSEFDTLVTYFVQASKEYTISYSREQAIKVWYLVAVMPLERKIELIKNRWGMTDDEIAISEAIVTSEAARNSDNTSNYCDSFGVTTTAIGMAKNKNMQKYGGDVYDQFIAPGHFEVYRKNMYQKNMGISNYGCLDALCAYAYTKDLGLTPLRIPFYIQFKANYVNFPEGTYIKLTSKGNKYQVKYYMPVWESVDSYQPYNALTDSYFHSIMDERSLCNIKKLQRVVQPEHW